MHDPQWFGNIRWLASFTDHAIYIQVLTHEATYTLIRLPQTRTTRTHVTKRHASINLKAYTYMYMYMYIHVHICILPYQARWTKRTGNRVMRRMAALKCIQGLSVLSWLCSWEHWCPLQDTQSFFRSYHHLYVYIRICTSMHHSTPLCSFYDTIHIHA